MGIETEIAKQDLLSLWRQFKSQADSWQNSTDSLDRLITTIEQAGFSEKADVAETAYLQLIKTKIKAALK